MAERAPFWQRLGSLGGQTITILLVLIVLVAVADKGGWLSDWSADRRFTLSPRLTALLTAQHEPIGLVGIWSQDPQLEPLEALLARMQDTAPKTVTWQRLDPELQKPLVSQFSTRFGVAQANTLYVTRGERAFAIPLAGDTRLVLQRDVGGALASLAETELPRALLLQGHGELRSDGGNEHGNHLLAQALSLSGYRVGELTAARSQAPSPESLLLIAGPDHPFGERDLALLSRHLADGGGIMIFADDRAPDDLIRWLRQHGVFVGGINPPNPADPSGNPQRIVVSLHHHFVGQEAAFPHHNLLLDREQMNPAHDITRALADAGVPLLAPWTAPVFALQPDPQDPQQAELIAAYRALNTTPFAATPLLSTAKADAWPKTRAAPLAAPNNLAEVPPLPLMWAIEYQPAADSVRSGIGGRLIVGGSRQMLADGVLAQASFANERLLRSAAAWAARRTAPSDIPTAEITAFQVTASDRTLTVIMGLLLAVMPCLCVGAAMLTWWDRR